MATWLLSFSSEIKLKFKASATLESNQEFQIATIQSYQKVQRFKHRLVPSKTIVLSSSSVSLIGFSELVSTFVRGKFRYINKE